MNEESAPFLDIIRFFCFFLVGFFGFSFFAIGFQPSRCHSSPKECYANMRIILGAIEMYNMDHRVMETKIDAKVLRKLYRGGWMKTMPHCPGFEVGSERNPSTFETWIDTLLGRDRYATATDDLATTSYLATGDLTSKDGQISCRIHGTIE